MIREVIQVKAEDISKLLYEVYDVPSGICEQVKNAFIRLEVIDNSKPSEALDYLERIRDVLQNDKCIDIEWVFKHEYNTIKQALITKSKKEQSIDIIKNKNVDTKYLISIIRDKYIKGKANKVWIYNSSVSEEDELTEKEYDLLNEVLK